MPACASTLPAKSKWTLEPASASSALKHLNQQFGMTMAIGKSSNPSVSERLKCYENNNILTNVLANLNHICLKSAIKITRKGKNSRSS